MMMMMIMKRNNRRACTGVIRPFDVAVDGSIRRYGCNTPSGVLRILDKRSIAVFPVLGFR